MSKVISFSKVSREQWEKLFGTEEEIRQRRSAHKNTVREYQNHAPVVLTGNERHYRVRHDPGLGVGYNSRQERERIMKEKGRICVG